MDYKKPTYSIGRPTIQGIRHVISAGHYLAATAGFQILECGGNAIDAGVAAGLALGVVQSEYVNIAGVAPIMIYRARTKEVFAISGLGTWPKAANIEHFIRDYGGIIPPGILRTVVPAAPYAWITALEKFGTMSFGEVAESAIRLAKEGFIMYPLMNEIITNYENEYRRWPTNAEIYLPTGEPPKVGDRFVQTDLAATLQYMVDEERSRCKSGRKPALQAALDAFYKGDIAHAIVAYHKKNDGLMTMDDMATFSVDVESSYSVAFENARVHSCGPWCQGPVLLQMLALLKDVEVRSMGHNSTEYIHWVVEAMKLAFADREQHYADPKFTAVPLDQLLSDEYSAKQREKIRVNRATNDVQAGDPNLCSSRPRTDSKPPMDTSYVCVIDGEGNAFSATPSDVSYDTPIIPGTGLCPSSRGFQSWADPKHPCAIGPGRRPRLTPNPALLIGQDKVMAFGTPGGDVQCQAMLQLLLNTEVFGMSLQEAIEAPRFATWSFPNSFEPHEYLLGRLNLERRIDSLVGEELKQMGHDVQWWPEQTYKAGGLCAVTRTPSQSTVTAGADPRRPCYAIGW
ncbi:MAG: gamma-glutamyltransferase [Rhodospirillaceae bacterium]|nr:gamma-glutamyltransferase [Rhodospirillaceae bacterium]